LISDTSRASSQIWSYDFDMGPRFHEESLPRNSDHPDTLQKSALARDAVFRDASVTPMESHDVLRLALEKGSPKEIAAAMGVSLSLVYKWAQPDENEGSGVANPLDRIAQLFELTRDEHLIQWLSQRAGGYFVRNPPSTCQNGFEVMPATQEIVQQFADLLGSISHAASDNAISEDEASKIRHVWDELKRFTEGFVKCCEEGDFANLKPLADGSK